MKLFVPAVGYRIKLTQPWSFELYHESRNDSLLTFVVPKFDPTDFDGRYASEKKLKQTTVSFPAGTLFEVDRVYVRNASKTAQSQDDDYDSVTFKLIEHPTFPVEKRIRFWAKLIDVNMIEYELPPDYTIGKEKAKENAKKPKKLTPERIKDLVSQGVRAHEYPSRGKIVPNWLTKNLIKQFKLIEIEHNRLREPWLKARYEADLQRRRCELEGQFIAGSLSLPISVAGKIKTVEDLLKHGHYTNYFVPYETNRRVRTWHYVVPYVVMGSYGVGSTTRERSPGGSMCRTFRPVQHEYEKDAPSLTHLWVKVYSDANDVEITNVEAGID